MNPKDAKKINDAFDRVLDGNGTPQDFDIIQNAIKDSPLIVLDKDDVKEINQQVNDQQNNPIDVTENISDILENIKENPNDAKTH